MAHAESEREREISLWGIGIEISLFEALGEKERERERYFFLGLLDRKISFSGRGTNTFSVWGSGRVWASERGLLNFLSGA